MDPDRVTIRRGPSGWEVLHRNETLGVFATHAEAIAHVSTRRRLYRTIDQIRLRVQQLTANLKRDNHIEGEG